MIKFAKSEDLHAVYKLVKNTIEGVYPLYYPEGAVDFFLSHHGKENILSDIENNRVYILKSADKILGTVTIKQNHILRLFVEENSRGKGLGGRLLNFAENKVFEKFDSVLLDSSLPAKEIYLKRGYRETNFRKILTSNGDFLCYDEMEKPKT